MIQYSLDFFSFSACECCKIEKMEDHDNDMKNNQNIYEVKLAFIIWNIDQFLTDTGMKQPSKFGNTPETQCDKNNQF